MKIEKTAFVRQGNELIEASYKIETLGESRLIRLLIAQIQPGDEEFKIYQIQVADFARIFGLNFNDGRLYELIDKAAESLTTRKITMREGKSWLHMNWLSSAKYINGAGCVELRFDPNLKPFLLQLKGYFTQYQLEKISNFKSLYSIRLFELLKMEQFKSTRDGQFQKTFEYIELREKLGIEEKQYEYVKDFRLYVIDIAVREINHNPDIFISKVDYPKTGRKITHIVFHCERARQTQLDLTDADPKLTEVKQEHPEDVRELISMGIDEATALKWRKKYGVKRLIQSLAYTRAMEKTGKIRDSVTGFLARTIADNLGGAWATAEKLRTAELKARESAENANRDADDKKATEERNARLAMLAVFHALPTDEQDAKRKAYESTLTGFALSSWNRALEKNKATPETDARIIVSFVQFLKNAT